MSAWDHFLTRVEPHDHLVQFYDVDDDLLVKKVGRYLFEGWKAGQGLLVVAEPERNVAIAEQLGALGMNTVAAAALGRLVFLDAAESLAQLTSQGPPDQIRFDALIGGAVRDLKTRHPRLRAYGEMVGVLWRRGQSAAAEKIEEFWNRTMQASAVSLFCAYPIDVFGKEFDIRAVGQILSAHTHVLPTGRDGEIGNAVDRAMAEILGRSADSLKKVIHTYFRPARAAVPNAESQILWLRSNLPQYAEEILTRARQYYTAN